MAARRKGDLSIPELRISLRRLATLRLGPVKVIGEPIAIKVETGLLAEGGPVAASLAQRGAERAIRIERKAVLRVMA